MDYTWGLPVGSGIPTAWPQYQYPQQIPGYNPYLMSHPWTAGYMPMYPYGGYGLPGMGGQMQQNQQDIDQVDIKPVQLEVAHSPNAKRRRVDQSDQLDFDTVLLDQSEYQDVSSSSTTPSPVIEEQSNSNDSSNFSTTLDLSVQNVDYSESESSHNIIYIPQHDSLNQSQLRSDSPPESDTSVNAFGNQLQESLMVVLPDGSKTALMDLQLPNAPFANYQPPVDQTFVFTAPPVAMGKAPRSRRSSGKPSGGKNHCHLCDKTYESRYKLKLHMHAHTGERPYVCEVCGKGFSRGPNLNAHMRVHTGAKPFSCTRCSRGFSHPSDRIIHMVTEVCLRAGRILRKVTEGWECTTCDSGVMEDKEHAERHARQHEAGRGLFCPICRTSFQGHKAHVLVKHVRENHPEYLQACGV